MKHTLASRFGDDTQQFLVDGVMPAGGYPQAMKDLHTKSVEDTIIAIGVNPIIGIQAPDVHKSELLLPRPYRAVLSQLRSGHSLSLDDYLCRIGKVPTPSCEFCDAPCQDTAHLFECPTIPTRLSPLDLWKRPLEVATFLSIHPSFSHLPPLSLSDPV